MRNLCIAFKKEKIFSSNSSSALSFIFYLFLASPAFSQQTTIIDTTSSRSHAVIVAGRQYKRSSWHNMFWGNHYREEWTTPVKVKSINSDTVFGGLKPVEKGGGRQTKTLRLKDKNGKQYVLRSINKTYTKALPEIFQKTFIESVANDQVSIAHPYSAITVPTLADAAKVFHTNPQIVFVPDQEGLGEYRSEFANNLYLLEERPAGFEGDAGNFGNTENVDGTEKMLRKIYEESDHRVDQQAFIRARLFDMFLSDWGRHEDQWRWATFEENGYKIYRPIPRDRDQAYTKFDGLLVALGKRAAQLVYLQSVDYTIKNVGGYNFQARHLDRQLANEPSLDTWQNIAKDLQQSLTDNIIENAIKNLPPEVYNISGPGLIAKLKSRRDKLVDFATQYYLILAKEVEVTGTKKKEVFEITGINDDEVKVAIFDLDNNGNARSEPFYSRNFHAGETKEVRLYGLGGKDQFKVDGTTGGKITIRLIGGPQKDSYTIPPGFGGKVKIYDDKENEFSTAKNTKMRLSEDSSVHVFEYAAYKKGFTGFKPAIGYSNEDRLFVGLGYQIQQYQWRKSPVGYQLDLKVNYSITQKAFSFKYESVYNQLIGKWNLGFMAEYDGVKDQDFAGVGNNSVQLSSKDRNYYLYGNKEANAVLRLFRQFGLHHTLSFSGFYQMIKVIDDADRFISVNFAPTDKTTFNTDHFAGAKAEYDFNTVNHKLFPSKGVRFITDIQFSQNLKETERSVTTVSGIFGFYVPIAPSLTLAIKTGAASVTGKPEFYQLYRLGGGSTLRGFSRYQFYGKTAFYNQNELQWNFNVKTYILSGKMGLVCLLDDGRVWQPGEVSNKWHAGVGGGVMIAPFNKISLTATYAKSSQDSRFNLRAGRLF